MSCTVRGTPEDCPSCRGSQYLRESQWSVPGGQAEDGTDTGSVRSGSGQVGAGDVEGLEGGQGGDQSLQELGGVSQVSPGLGTLRHVQMTQLLQLTDGLQRFLHICQHIKITFSALQTVTGSTSHVVESEGEELGETEQPDKV